MPAAIPISPCLCRDHLESDTGDMIAEAKVDGVRCVVHVTDAVRAWTRNGRFLDIGIEAEIAAKALGHEVIDAEFKGGVLYVFDLPAFGGSWRIRRSALVHAYSRVEGMPGIALVPVLHDPAEDDGYPEDTNAILAKAIKAGFEGVVLKDPDAPYSEGSRSWAKVKPEATEDLRVVDYLYNGSLVVNRRGVKVTVGIGLPVAIRAAKAAMLGRLIELRFQEVTLAGSLRHPVFIRLRDDKEEVN